MKARCVAGILFALLLPACTGRPADTAAGAGTALEPTVTVPPPPFQLTANQQSGRVIYETVCWTCHGEAGRGDGPAVKAGSVPAPPSFYGPSIAGVSPDELERRFQASIEGDPQSHPHMRYVAVMLRPERFKDALSYVPVLTYPPEVPGSAMAGRARYAKMCLGCHGAAGKGNGPAAEVLVTKPVSFPADTLLAAGDYEGVFQRIKQGGVTHGTSMPPWGLMLSDDDIWDLVAYLATFQRVHLSAPPGAER